MNIEDTLKLAIKLHNAHDVEEARGLYEKILKQDANHPDANHLAGIISLSIGNIDDASTKFKKAIKVQPNEAIYYNSLGNLFKIENKIEEALGAYSQAVGINPGLHEAQHNLGRILEKIGSLDDAKYHLGEAVQADPTSYESNFSLARILVKLENFNEAKYFFQQALTIEPDNAGALNGFAFTLEKLNMLDEAIQFYEKSLQNEPDVAATLSNLGHALLASGSAKEAIYFFKKCLRFEPDNQVTWDRYLFALTFSETSDRDIIFQENKRWAAEIEKKVSLSVSFSNLSLNPNKKIKIGYYSNEFYSHVTSLFFKTLLKFHDRERYEIYCYSNSIKQDEVTAYLQRNSDIWRDVSKIEPKQIAQKVRADDIDIFVGTTNFLASNRIILAHQPAPVIVSYMNQVSTTGLSNVDYLIGDDKISPVGFADDFFTEHVIRLSDFICYCPPEIEVRIKPPPLIANGYITFGCFNNLAKLNKKVILKWSDILNSVPNSKIKLVAGGFKDLTLQARYLKLFEALGIQQNRIEFVTSPLERAEYLSQYNSIDIALDPFPFNGGTVSDEALYMSVPLITLAGNTEMGRMSMSKLSRLKLHELIAFNLKDYVQIAVDLAGNVDKIKKFKTEIREIALVTIFNGKDHVKELESVYRQMWRDYCVKNN
jgi:protein O-GlcNAc transferase